MVTIKDVAKSANVSTSTVSHVINNDRYVSPAIREKVELVIKQLNYTPSAIARSLKSNKTYTIGMLVTASNNPFFSEVVQGVERSCYELGYNLILCSTEGDHQRMLDNIEHLLQKRVDGLLAMCTETYSIPKQIFARYPKLPIVMMDWKPFDGMCDIIQDNSFFGAMIATQYLIKQNYKQIACITGPLNNTQAQSRLQGYRQAMQDANLEILRKYEAQGDFQFASGIVAMQNLLELSIPPQAVFCSNDAMAIGAYQALYQNGLEAGKDIAIIGYDDIEIAQYMTPPLTTIHQPKEELGQLAVETLLNRFHNPTDSLHTLTLTPTLIKRLSA
ncbi:transcriptional regulator, LacI family [Gilliamella bombicola]|uniref:Transcriptional regulator, LacI family n=1 Tax=Gilliamella bombicola TaxID=1798182 RepID=A0A1C4AL19_9GAMM|nr:MULTISPECIES: ribose operon transcriptional repressor RbsR [Gilliamella]MWN05628.1 ribose operon transcriptional repressor RbsR [Gilliamella sp. Pas-s95]NUF26656.1 ribose operon transcriptional repressor RbsR [Gilliamella sp. ESL0254]SCB95279.1 transcriptional regulator, LacI family [Gilliamella bombicola]